MGISILPARHEGWIIRRDALAASHDDPTGLLPFGLGIFPFPDDGPEQDEGVPEEFEG